MYKYKKRTKPVAMIFFPFDVIKMHNAKLLRNEKKLI
jgi:hypothetical protein